MELLGDGLCEGGPDVLPDLGFAGVHRDPAVLADVQPGTDVLGCGTAAEAAAPPPARLLRLRFGGVPVQQVEDEESAAHRLEEVAAIDLEPVGGSLSQLIALELDLVRVVRRGDRPDSFAHRPTSFTA